MQNFFAKHYRWMFAFLLIVIVIPFVFAYGPASQMGGNNRATTQKENMFFGHNMADEAHMQGVARKAAIGRWLTSGTPPANAEELQMLVLERIVTLDIVNRLGVPTPTQEQLAVYIAGLPPFVDAQGFFSKAKFEEFQARFARDEGLPKSYLGERIAESWQINQLTSRLENASFYLPSTLQREYGLIASKYNVTLAIVSGALQTKPEINETEAKAYFDANKEKYETPELRSGTVYKIDGAKFLSQVPEATDEQLQKYFDTIAFRFIKWQTTDKDGNVTGEAPKPPTLAENRDETLKLYRQSRAARAAAEAVDVIVQKIYAENIAPGSPAWAELIKSSGVEVLPLENISQDNEKIDENTLQMLFARSLPDRAYSSAFVTQADGRFVLLTAVTPVSPQNFQAVATRVNADALKEKQEQMMLAQHTAKIEKLKDAWASNTNKKDFAALARENGFSVLTPAPFTLNELPREVMGQRDLVRQLVSSQPNGLSSDVTLSQGVVALLNERQTPAFDTKDEKALQIRAQVERIYSRITTLGFLNEWAAKHGRG